MPAGKLIHSGADQLTGSDYSLVDFNRAGELPAKACLLRYSALPRPFRVMSEHWFELARLSMSHGQLCVGYAAGFAPSCISSCCKSTLLLNQSPVCDQVYPC